jgi:hypothetical protein
LSETSKAPTVDAGRVKFVTSGIGNIKDKITAFAKIYWLGCRTQHGLKPIKTKCNNLKKQLVEMAAVFVTSHLTILLEETAYVPESAGHPSPEWRISVIFI